MPNQTLIIGAGLAGLTCARQLGPRALVVEAQPFVGGVATTHQRSGFHFDCTGHWLHLRDPRVQALVATLLPDAWRVIERRAAIYSHGRFTPYPFQANTFGLPPDVVADCVLGYFAAQQPTVARGEPRSLEDFIRSRMGDGIADHFMVPYNTKLWTLPPAEMDHRWCHRFVPLPTAEEVVYGAIRPGGAGGRMGYNATFLYPHAGGIGVLAQVLADDPAVSLRLGCAVRGIRWRDREATFADGSTFAFGDLVSTMPLPDLVASMVDVPEAIADAAARLRAVSVTYWDLGFARPNAPKDPHWIYFPGADLPFYRVGSASAVAPHVAPPGHRSYCVEVSHRRGEPCGVSDTAIMDGLRRVGLVAHDEEPIVCERSTIGCAYALMDHHYHEARQTILQWLGDVGIDSIGRYGAWMYDSMEGAMGQGMACGERLRHR